MSPFGNERALIYYLSLMMGLGLTHERFTRLKHRAVYAAHMTDVYPMRINKYLAHKKYCTRGEADTMIEAGKVQINGRRAVLGDKVQENDNVQVFFRVKKYRYFAYNKPRGVITHSPDKDERDIRQSIPLVGVFPIGRLDKDSKGLIILTDDGRITDKLLNPEFEHEKEYIVSTKESLSPNFKERIEPGVNIEGYKTKPCKVKILGDKQFSIVLTEGKKHQIRRMCSALGYAVALSLIMNLFVESSDKAKAMGFFGFVASGGGAIGVFLGGILTTIDWHWNFLVNVPIGIIVFALVMYLLPKNEGRHVKLDLMGAVTITLTLMLAVYAIVNGNAAGWLSTQTLSLLGGAAILFISFLWIEKRAPEPLVPLSIFSKGNISVASIIGILWSAAMFSWFFLSALYLQLVLGYDPLSVGLSFLPGNILMAMFSVGLSAYVVVRFGVKKPLAIGMGMVSLGLITFALAPVDGSFLLNVLPGMLLLGFGAGLAFNPVLMAGTDGIPHEESGLASGVLNTAFMMGGSLGLAILASLAAVRTESVSGSMSHLEALLSGYHIAFLFGAVFVVCSALLVLFFKVFVLFLPFLVH